MESDQVIVTTISDDRAGDVIQFIPNPISLCYSSETGVALIAQSCHQICAIRPVTSERMASLQRLAFSQLLDSAAIPIPQLIAIIIDFAVGDSMHHFTFPCCFDAALNVRFVLLGLMPDR